MRIALRTCARERTLFENFSERHLGHPRGYGSRAVRCAEICACGADFLLAGDENSTNSQVEEVFKSPKGFKLPSDQTLIVDRFGGSMTTFAGLVIRDGSRIDFMGQTYVGGRYVFFLRQVHEGKDLSILTAYEFRDGRVFKLTEDGSPGKVLLSKTPEKADSLSDEQEFLQAVRQ
jgi:hypothetical protein